MSDEESQLSGSPERSDELRQISTRVLHVGRRFRFEELTVHHRTGDGEPEVSRREIVRHPGAVVILPVMQGGQIALIRCYRAAINETIWELPAGTLDRADESPTTCAHRELLEETGCKAGNMTSLGWFYTTPGLTDERMHAFMASGCVQTQPPELEPGENISVCMMEPRIVFEMIQGGELCDAKSMLTLLLSRHHFAIVDGN